MLRWALALVVGLLAIAVVRAAPFPARDAYHCSLLGVFGPLAGPRRR